MAQRAMCELSGYHTMVDANSIFVGNNSQYHGRRLIDAMELFAEVHDCNCHHCYYEWDQLEELVYEGIRVCRRCETVEVGIDFLATKGEEVRFIEA